MKKRGIIALALVLACTLCACAGAVPPSAETAAEPEEAEEMRETAEGPAEPIEITVWVPEAIVTVTRRQIEDFNAINAEGIVIDAAIEAVEESAAAKRLLTGEGDGADLFCFGQQWLVPLAQAGLLESLDGAEGERVRAASDPDAAAAASLGDRLYAYPLTADEGYFLYYDRSVIPEEDLGSLEKLLEDCRAAGKRFAMETLSNGRYLASWFLGAGCISQWECDSEGAYLAVRDTFNSPAGLLAARGMKTLLDDRCFLNSSDPACFEQGCAALVSDREAYAAAARILGEDLGTAALPDYEVDGKRCPMGSFCGFRLLGVRAREDAESAAALHSLAQYLSDELGQLERFYEASWGPSNLAALSEEGVGSHPAVAGAMAQKARATAQGRIHRSWWDASAALGAEIQRAWDEPHLQEALEHYEEALSEALVRERDAMLFVGDWNGWDRLEDSEAFYLADNGDGTASVTLEVPEKGMGGCLVRPGEAGTDRGYAQVTEGAALLRKPGTRNTDNRIVFREAGVYTVTLVRETGEIRIAASGDAPGQGA